MNSGSLQLVGACTDSLESSKRFIWVPGTPKHRRAVCLVLCMQRFDHSYMHYITLNTSEFTLIQMLLTDTRG